MSLRCRGLWRAVCFGSWICEEEVAMKKMKEAIDNANGKAGWILLWALGVPIPVLLVLYLLRGCT